MTGRAKTNQLPRGVTLTPNGRVKVVLTIARGSRKTVSRTYHSIDLALKARETGIKAREEGRDVAAALDAVRGQANCPASVQATSPAGRVSGRSFARRVSTLGAVIDKWHKDRDRLVKISDPTFPNSRKRPEASLRSTSRNTERRLVETHLRPAFGNLRTTEIDRERVSQYIRDLAEGGYSTRQQNKVIVTLRQIIATLPRSRQPDDFPWHGVSPIRPKNPNRPRPNPEKWSGLPGEEPPVVAMETLYELAQKMWAPDRIICYLGEFLGLRIGESLGIQLGSFYSQHDRWWVRIRSQRTKTGAMVPWVKSDASYRDLPVPERLFRYLIEYTRRYHGVDLRAVPASHRARPLACNPAGRALDGSFLPALEVAWMSRWIDVRNENGASDEKLGYFLTSHHFRKSLSTYLLHAPTILGEIDKAQLGPRPRDTDRDALLAYYQARERIGAAERGFYDADVSAFLGQEDVLAEDEAPASSVTLRHYHLTGNGREKRFMAIADAIDRMIEFEIGELVDEPDDRDLYPPLFPDDPEWVEIHEAAQLIGVTFSRMHVIAKEFGFERQYMWRADGGHLRNEDFENVDEIYGDQKNGTGKRTPALPVAAMRRKDLAPWEARRGTISVKEAARRLGVSGDLFKKQRLVARGVVEGVEIPGNPPRVVVTEASVDQLLATLHGLVLDALEEHGPCSADVLRAHIEWSRAPIAVERMPRPRWVRFWLDQLVAQGKVSRFRDGRYRVRPYPKPPSVSRETGAATKADPPLSSHAPDSRAA